MTEWTPEKIIEALNGCIDEGEQIEILNEVLNGLLKERNDWRDQSGKVMESLERAIRIMDAALNERDEAIESLQWIDGDEEAHPIGADGNDYDFHGKWWRPIPNPDPPEE